jgi:hypothetical protein
MPLTGGLRDRMILDNVLRQVMNRLETLNWAIMEPDGTEVNPLQDSYDRIRVIDEYPSDPENVEVPINTMAFSAGDSFQDMLELGSNGETHYSPIYIDFFAASDALMRHVMGDIYAWINENPVIPITDYSIATPAVDFYAILEEESVSKDRPARATNPWMKHWLMVSFILRDDRPNG